MFIGHFAVALAAKKAAPKASLGALILSAQFVDMLWPALLLLGIEHVRISPGDTLFTPLDFYDYPISHSLLMTLVWAGVVGAIYYFRRKDRRTALVLGALVTSHWLLDLATHRPDLPLAPGAASRFGLGLWNSVGATLVVESLMFAAALIVYLRSTEPSDRTGRIAPWTLIGFLTVTYIVNVVSPPPPSVNAIAYAGLAMWLFLPWGNWIERHRPAKPNR